MSDDIKILFWKALADSPNVMVGATGEREHHIPMQAQLDKDASSAVWFFTATDNRLSGGGPAMAQFSAKGHELFACISGTLVHESDRSVLDKLWNNSIAAWYEGGKDDPKPLRPRRCRNLDRRPGHQGYVQAGDGHDDEGRRTWPARRGGAVAFTHPFVSSEVETPIVNARPRGISTSSKG